MIKGRETKIVILLLLSLYLFMSGCMHFAVDARAMITDMNKLQSSKYAHINILWYEGYDSEYHYFSYVYGMLRGRNYKVPLDQLIVGVDMPFSDESERWIPVKELGDVWFATRLYNGVWKPDAKGITIDLNH